MNRGIAILAVAFVVWSVAVALGWLVPIDTAAINAMAAVRSPLLTQVADNFTALGSAPVVACFATLGVVYFMLAGHPRLSLALLWTPLTFVVCSLVKLVVHRPRPVDALVIVPGHVFLPERALSGGECAVSHAGAARGRSGATHRAAARARWRWRGPGSAGGVEQGVPRRALLHRRHRRASSRVGWSPCSDISC